VVSPLFSYRLGEAKLTSALKASKPGVSTYDGPEAARRFVTIIEGTLPEVGQAFQPVVLWIQESALVHR